MSEVDSKDFMCEYNREKYETFSSSELQNKQKDLDTIPNSNNFFFFKNKIFSSLYWNTQILLSSVTTCGRIYVWLQKIFFKIMLRLRFSIF